MNGNLFPARIGISSSVVPLYSVFAGIWRSIFFAQRIISPAQPHGSVDEPAHPLKSKGNRVARRKGYKRACVVFASIGYGRVSYCQGRDEEGYRAYIVAVR